MARVAKTSNKSQLLRRNLKAGYNTPLEETSAKIAKELEVHNDTKRQYTRVKVK